MFFKRFESLCIKSGSDVSNTLRALGLSTSKGTAWRNGSIPNGEILLKIASYFHVSTDYLLGNTDNPAPAGQKEKPTLNFESGLTDSLDIQLMKELPGLTPDQKELLLAQIRVLKDRK